MLATDHRNYPQRAIEEQIHNSQYEKRKQYLRVPHSYFVILLSAATGSSRAERIGPGDHTI